MKDLKITSRKDNLGAYHIECKRCGWTTIATLFGKMNCGNCNGTAWAEEMLEEFILKSEDTIPKPPNGNGNGNDNGNGTH